MITAGEFRNGVTFEEDGKVLQVVEFQHVKPGKGAAFVRTKTKNVMTGAVTETSYNPTAKFPQATIERREMVYSYNDGEWNELVSVTNNGDGTLTVVMDHFCPTVFCVSTDEVTNNPQAMPPKTGDAVGQNLTLYIVVMVASLAAIVAIVVIRRKASRK